MNHLKSFSSFNESWKSIVAAGMLLLTTACDNVLVKSKATGKETSIDDYKGTGVIKEITKIPLKNSCQYLITIEDSKGDIVEIEKIAHNPFPDDETPGYFFLSDLEEGSKVKVDCDGDDCKVYLEK